MQVHKDIVRIVFGHRLRHYRVKMGLSHNDLSQASGISKSYLSEIEKGKKYPQSDKILQLSRVLNVSYDQLVQLSFIDEYADLNYYLLSSSQYSLPFEALGLDIDTIRTLILRHPESLSTLLHSFDNFSADYSFSRQDCFETAARTFKERHQFYFDQIETTANSFRLKYLKGHDYFTEPALSGILKEKFGISLLSSEQWDLENNDSNLQWTTDHTAIALNPKLDSYRRRSVLLELIYYLMFADRMLYATAVQDLSQLKSKVLAEYFALACMIDRIQLSADLQILFDRHSWSDESLYSLIRKYRVSALQLVTRIAHLLINQFSIRRYTLTSVTKSRKEEKATYEVLLNFAKPFKPMGKYNDKQLRPFSISTELINNIESMGWSIQKGGEFHTQRVKLTIDDEEFEFFNITAIDEKPESDQLYALDLNLLIDESLKSKVKSTNGLNLKSYQHDMLSKL